MSVTSVGLSLKCTDPEVIAVVLRNMEAQSRFFAKAHEWAAERGSEDGAFFPTFFAKRLSVEGLPDQPEGFGQWTKASKRNGAHWPYRSNTEESRKMASLTVHMEDVPGVPTTLHAPGFLMWPTPFVQDEVAWLGYPQMPVARERERIGEQWVECLPSEYLAAHEAYYKK